MDEENARELFKLLFEADVAISGLEGFVEELDPDTTASGVLDSILKDLTPRHWQYSEDVHRRLHAIGIPMFIEYCGEHPNSPPIGLVDG